MLAVQVQVLLLLLERVQVMEVGTAMLGDLLVHHLLEMLEDLLLVRHLLLARVRMAGRTMKAVAGTQTLDEIVLVRIRKQQQARPMHHHVLVVQMV
jgi:hypothetical protein